MAEGLFSFGIPIVIAVFFIYFLWAWILMTVKPPKETTDEWAGVKLYPRWNHLEAEPQGIQKRVAQEVEQKRKAA